MNARRYETTMVDNHSHTALVDTKGNGTTTVIDRHRHLVHEFKLAESHGHTHERVK